MKRIGLRISIIFFAFVFYSLVLSTSTTATSDSAETPSLRELFLALEKGISSDYISFLMTCCAVFFADLPAHLRPSDTQLDTESRRNELFLLSIHDGSASSGSLVCEELLKKRLAEMNDAEYLAFAILFRTCEAVNDRHGFFSVHYYGSLPHHEVIPSEKYRIAFYTRLSDFSVAAHESMVSPDKTYLKLVITLNTISEFANQDSKTRFLATLDCDGSWRTFHERPEQVSEIFQFHTHEFSLAQNDQCEELIMNDLRLPPRIAEKKN